MSSGLVTRWPGLISESPDLIHSAAWLQEGFRTSVSRLWRATRSSFTSRALVRLVCRLVADGHRTVRKRRAGRRGIVSVATAAGTFAQGGDETAHELYADGSERWWRWRAPLEVQSRSGFVPRAYGLRDVSCRLQRSASTTTAGARMGCPLIGRWEAAAPPAASR